MRLAVIFLALAAALSGAPTISNAAVDNISAHTARFAWTTDVASTGSRILVGTSDPPTTSIVAIGSSSVTTHVWFASGLTPGTLYYWQVCATNAGETCTASGTFTTLAAEPGVATPPNAPATFSTTYPTINGSTYNVAADCSDLQSQINTAAAQDGSLNHEVVIPAGALCVGRYTLPVKTGANPTGDGFVVVRGGAVLPPAGSRVTSDFSVNYPTLMSPYIYAYYDTDNPSAGSCLAGELYLDSDAGSNWINLCTAVNTWTNQTVTTGAGAPSGSCTAGAWYRNTSDANLKSAHYWCIATDTWRNVYIDGDSTYTAYAAISPAASAKGYRITGVKLTALPRPTVYTDLLSRTSGNGYERPATSFCLAYSKPTNTNIFYDRVWFEGQGFPHRQNLAICQGDGTNIAVIDSYFNEINRWRPNGQGEWTANAVIFYEGPGPAIIRNNYFKNVGGMAVFHSDDNALGQTNDVTIHRNDFYIDPSLNQAEATGSRLYYFRHHIELKRGARWSIVGNTFNGGFPSGNPNAAGLGITPRNGPSNATQCRTNTNGVWDLDIRSNKFLYSPMPLLLTGHNDSKSCNTYTTIRTRFSNNVVYITGKSSTGNTLGPTGLRFNGQMNETGLGFEDLIFTNNLLREPTAYSNSAKFFSFAGDWDDWPNSRLQFENNLYFGTNIQFQWQVQVGGNATYGTAAFEQMIEPNTAYSYKGNARQRGATGGADNNPAYPSGNYSSHSASDFSTSFYRCVICGDEGEFRPLYNSKFAAGSATARGYDARDAGPDFVQFDVDQGILYNQRALSITSSGATVYWTAPDSSTACTVEYGTSATPGTGSRVTDTPTSRFRSRALTGLSAGTTYYYRIYCGRMISGSFRTI